MEQINKILNKRAIKTFDAALVQIHAGSDHSIFPIPANYTLMDAVSYIFSDNIHHVAEFLNKYNYKVRYAMEIMDILEEGIITKSLCLTCLRNDVTHKLQ